MFGVPRPSMIVSVLSTVLFVAVTECGSRDLVAADRLASVLIRDVPHVRQKPDFCGEAWAQMWLRQRKVAVDQDYVFDQSGLEPILGRGCYTKELAQALKRIGFRIGEVYTLVPVRTAEAALDKAFAELHSDLKQGVPSIVCMHFDDRPKTTEHFRLVLGYDQQADEVVYHDPAVDDGANLRMERREFLKLWPLKYAADNWTLARMRLDAGKLPTATAAANERPANLAESVQYGAGKPHQHAGVGSPNLLA